VLTSHNTAPQTATNHIQQNQRSTPHAVTHGHGICSPEDGHNDAPKHVEKLLIINIKLLRRNIKFLVQYFGSHLSYRYFLFCMPFSDLLTCTIYYIPSIHNNINIYFFDVFLTVLHLSIFISVINQRDEQKSFFTVSLFHACTCFEHCCAHHQEVKIVLYSIWCHHTVGDRPVHSLGEDCAPDGHLQSDDTRYCIIHF